MIVGLSTGAGAAWLLLGLGAAVLQAGRLAVIKYAFADLGPGLVTLILSLSCAVLSAPLLLLGDPLPLADPWFWMLTLAGSIAAGCGALSINAAVRAGELSRVAPLLGLTPLLVALIEGLVHGTWPSLLGGLGMLCILIGALQMARKSGAAGLDSEQGGLHHGARLALQAAPCFALAICLGREGVLRSDATAFAGLIALLSPPVTLAVVAIHDPGVVSQLRRLPLRRLLSAALVLGGLFALMRLCDLMALELALGGYVSAVKRSAGLFSVVIGIVVFREGAAVGKLLWSAAIVLGLTLLQIWG